MAYTIPVAALIFDETQAALALKRPSDFFQHSRNPRWDAVEDLVKLTGAPVESFTDEEGEIFYFGIRLTSDWRIDITPKLIGQAQALRKQYQHPLVQLASLAVVSEFC